MFTSQPAATLSLLALLPLTTLALPSASNPPSNLTPRSNQYRLRCGNAPNVIAGDIAQPSDILTTPPNPYPPSGSNQDWLSYLWCTPSTTTYTFFNIGELSPPPLSMPQSANTALNASLATISAFLSSNPDQPVRMPGQEQQHYFFQSDVDNSHMSVSAWSHGGGLLTFGILHSALAGLLQYMAWGSGDGVQGYNKGNSPFVFQISDGQWGTVGLGYVGLTGWAGGPPCVYQVVGGKGYDCNDVFMGKLKGI